MAIQKSRSQSGIDLTLKVLQFVKQLRRRLRPGPPTVDHAAILGAQICASLDTKKFQMLQTECPRSRSHNRKITFAASGVYKNQNKRKRRPSLKLRIRGDDKPSLRNKSGMQVQQTLNSIDTKVSICGSPLSAAAGDHKLFLKQKTDISFETCSLNEVAQLLITVHDAINVLQSCRTQFDDEWLVAQGHDAGINFDVAFLANYEHLLMRLHSQLVNALSRKALDLLLLGGYDKRQYRLLSWFTEFSDKPRPLSTSLDIKPSLAVLWGVCWMFYANSQTNNGRVPSEAVLQHVDLPDWRRPEPTEYRNFGLELVGAQPQLGAPQRPQPANSVGLSSGVDLRLRNAETWMPADLESGVPQVRRGASRGVGSGLGWQGLAGLGTYYPQFPATSPIDDSNLSNLLPDIQGNATALTVFPQQHLDHNFDNTWQHFPHNSLPQRTARHLTTSIPSVRVTGTAESEGYAAPHLDFAAFDIFPSSTQSPQAPSININTDFPDFAMGSDTITEQHPAHGFSAHRHERTSSLHSNSNMPTPISLADTHSPLLSPADGHRRFSVASSQGHVRQQSEDTSSQGDPEDADSPRRNHAYKRAEEPPRNHDGKMICKHSECAGQTFDRKCEWSKHMDKHDRPYKCNFQGCEKLQGFTYSGGLLRHEREVHKMHGGTKKSLFCPFADCKRSSGAGFTRKENLAEHIRRVHRRTSMSADLGHLIIPREQRQSSLAADVRMPAEKQYERIVEEDEAQLTLKRKRPEAEELEEMDLRSELRRLRREAEEKDARLRQLEAAVMALQQR
ncbi:C2H2 transcription factor [Paraphaeosphaeria sporulosa]